MPVNIPVIGMKKQLTKKMPWIISRRFSHRSGLFSAFMDSPMKKVESAIINLENLMENVDDSTRVQINSVIRELTDMNDVFAEMAPMPEERQMAIVEQIYDNNLRTLELITDKFNK